YTISEDVVSGYTTVINNSTAGNFTITNTHVTNVTEVNVTKVWNDSNDQDGIRPKNVTVYLLADGNRVNETMLNDTNSWKFNFKDLPVYKDGKKINYTVIEVNVAGYTTDIRNSTAGNFTITNTHVTNVTEVNVTKVWNDSNNQDGIRPVNVTVHLYADGVESGQLM
ncbi:Cna B-type domain-containing protein, partial [uncultured Methanobrevibacter sp.]|uniref:Cna B-type domain-containing protein n=1 Tax=uncultured Methanobrevibacter sp. TaxID=253161 RepID=UPI0025F8EB24